MPDYGRPLTFGYFLTPTADPAAVLAAAAQVEDLGLDLIGIQDHPYQRRFLDTFTLLAYLAARTTRVRFFSDVASLPLRPPAMLAKAAASLDILSGGRFDLGLGAGAFWEAIAAMGGPARTPAEAVAAVEDAIAILRLAWSQERSIKHDGPVYSVKGMQPGPLPAHSISIWLGAYGPRMLSLLGRAADGWVPSLNYLRLDQIPAQNARIDDAALAAGRDPASIRRIVNLWGDLTNGPVTGLLQGPVSQWVETLTLLAVEHGFDTFMLGGEPGATLARLAHEVVPAVRESVAHARAWASPSKP